MKCKNCENEILEGEQFCGKCGTKVSANIINEKNTTNNKEPIKIKFNHIVIIILLIVVIGIIGGFFAFFNGKEKVQSIIQKQPNWIENIGSEKVFNIEYAEFVEKCKTRLEELSTMTVEESDKGKFIGGEINYPEGWILTVENKNTNYAYGQLLFQEYIIGRMLKIEEYQGKVKSITFLDSTDSLSGTIAEQTVIEVLESYGIYDENNSESFKEKVDMKTERFDNATVSLGKYLTGYSSSQIIVDAYRKNGNFGYIPYEYNKSEVGNYVTITIK